MLRQEWRHKPLDWKDGESAGSTMQPAPAPALPSPAHAHTLTLAPGSLNMATTPISQNPSELGHRFVSVTQSWRNTGVPRPCSPWGGLLSTETQPDLPSCPQRSLEA